MTAKGRSRHSNKSFPTSKQQPRQQKVASQVNLTAIIQRASVDPTSLTARDVAWLRQTVGNQAVGRLLAKREKQRSAVSSLAAPDSLQRMLNGRSGFSNANKSRDPVRVQHFYPAGGLVQAKFIFDETSGHFVDEDTKEAYKRLGTVAYGDKGRKAYQLQRLSDSAQIHIDVETYEIVTIGPAPSLSSSPEKKRKKEEAFPESDSDLESEFSEASDDEKIELDAKQKFEILTAKGRRKRLKLRTKNVATKEGVFSGSDLRSRKIYAAHRSSKSSLVSNINKQELLQIGEQTVRIDTGTGYFIVPGGNKEKRPPGIKEPPGDYESVFEAMKKMGKDPNAAPLYKLATGSDLGDKDALADAEIAAMALYYINNDAAQIQVNLGQRTQLTENLSKLTAITTISELARALEATKEGEEIPYDATLLVKQCFWVVMQGQKTLKEVFYEGKGGKESIFLGAPSEKHSGISGADRLRRPHSYRQPLEKQMGIFPSNKRKYIQQLNAFRSKSTVKAPALTAEQQKALQKKYQQEQVKEARDLVQEIQDVDVPHDSSKILGFLTDRSGAIQKLRGKIRKLRRRFAGNKEAIELLDEAQRKLKKKEKRAQEVL